MNMRVFICAIAMLITGCATPPSSDPSSVESSCALQCSANLATCSSGFKLFPIVQQKQCNDTYDICIKGCPARIVEAPLKKSTSKSSTERIKELDELFKGGAITKDEYEAKRKEVLNSI